VRYFTNKIKSKLQALNRNKIIKRLIRPGELVLEVGSGNSPMKISTVLLDKFVSPTEVHRSNKKPVSQLYGKPFMLGDGSKLPFKDQSIGTIICRQVIEHVDDPAGFLKELQRVGKRGYLEWPSIFCELIRGGYGDQGRMRDLFLSALNDNLAQLEHGKGTRGHRWFIVPIGSSLYFTAKNKEQYPLYLMYGAYAKAEENKKHLSRLLGASISFRTWSEDGHIEAVILQENSNNDVADLLAEHYSLTDQIKFIENMLGKYSNPMNLGNIRKALCCPVCKRGDLLDIQINGGKYSLFFSCTICNRKYPIIHGIPILIDQATDVHD